VTFEKSNFLFVFFRWHFDKKGMAHHHFINSTFSDFHGPTAVDISKQQETQSSSISQHEEQQQQSRFSKKKTDLDVTKIPLLVRQSMLYSSFIYLTL
jgi:hypothetical protein